MKKLLSLLLVLAACASGNKETGAQDSVVAYSDTIAAAVVNETTSAEETQEQVRDTSQLEITFDETAGLVYERHEQVYTVSIVTQQYEATSDVTWYFDDDFSPIYFKEIWAAEGNEGSTEYFIMESGDVACALTQEYSTIEKWCRTTGGTRFTINDESGDVTPTDLLPFEYGTTVNTELSRYMNILKTILKDAEITSEDENSYTLRIEKTVNYGQDYTESVEVSIPKKVYDSISN